MGDIGFGIFMVLAIILSFFGWYAARAWDKERIETYLRERGGRVVSINWAPWGKGWFGEKNDRIYEVVYYDAQGRQHMATCKTSYWGGVYWTDDRLTHRRAPWYERVPARNEPGDPVIKHLPGEEEVAMWLSEDDSAIDAEIERLRKRLDELEQRKRERL
jgi:hypothetical protein